MSLDQVCEMLSGMQKKFNLKLKGPYSSRLDLYLSQKFGLHVLTESRKHEGIWYDESTDCQFVEEQTR